MHLPLQFARPGLFLLKYFLVFGGGGGSNYIFDTNSAYIFAKSGSSCTKIYTQNISKFRNLRTQLSQLNCVYFEFTKFSITVFLDIKFRFDDQIGLVTDINIKKTDARAYLHYNSYHPRQTFPSIVYSQALRYRRIINSDATLRERLDDLTLCFINSGYPNNMIRGIMDDVAKRKITLDYRKKDAGAPFPVVWVQTFGPATPEISKPMTP